ncbi:MAG: DUF4124 domain-containing protein [Xanthomonadales bacterium]|nr:DUF4124 domain-containing protein [Xanthomonadales bacterium]
MKTSFLKITLPTLALMLAASTAVASDARLYKWLDGNGNMHFGDRLPMGQDAQRREEFNHNGIRIRQLDLSESSETVTERQEMLRTANRDTALVASFQDEMDLRRSHEDFLSNLRSSMAIGQANAKRMRSIVEDGQAVGDSAGSARAQALLDEQMRELDKLEARYERVLISQALELRRFRELTAVSVRTSHRSSND